MQKRPDVIIILHTKDHSVAIREANQMNIPSVGIVDSNADGRSVTYPIIGNDDSLDAQLFYCQVFLNAFYSKNFKHSSKNF